MMLKVDRSSFELEVLNSAIPVVVDFWAEWCGPCRMIGSALEELAQEHLGKLRIVKLNVEENPDVAARYGVTSIPTLLLFRGGVAVDVKVGASPKRIYSEWITKNRFPT